MNTPTALLSPILNVVPAFIVMLSVAVGTDCVALLNIPTPFSPTLNTEPLFAVTFLPYIP